MVAIDLQWAGGRHDLKIAHLTVPSSTAEVAKTETFDRIMQEVVARSIVSASNRIWTQLHHAKRRGRSREGLPQAIEIVFTPLGDGANHRQGRGARLER